MAMPQAAIAQSIAIAAMPTFSAQVARGKENEMRASLAATLRGVLFLSIPACPGLDPAAAPQITTLLYQGHIAAQSALQWSPGRCCGMPWDWLVTAW